MHRIVRNARTATIVIASALALGVPAADAALKDPPIFTTPGYEVKTPKGKTTTATLSVAKHSSIPSRWLDPYTRGDENEVMPRQSRAERRATRRKAARMGLQLGGARELGIARSSMAKNA